MSVYTYKQLVTKAKEVKESVEKEYTLGTSRKWSYYFGKAILNPKKDITKISFEDCGKSVGENISRDVYKSKYIDMAKRHTKYVEEHKKLPLTTRLNQSQDYKISAHLTTYFFASILVYYDKHGELPQPINLRSKVFTPKTETANSAYNYFVQVFGKIDCIDDALDKISGRGYGYYYDDVYSNKQSIDRMKNRQGVNCTDSCHVFYNICLGLIQRGIYKKVECIHVKCRGGDGHVRLRITNNKGQKFYRDPACTLSDGGYCNWCMDGTVLAVDPSWFMANLNR